MLDEAKVFKEGAERQMAASKLKHELEHLNETTALYGDLMELQDNLPVWKLPARAFFERLSLAIEGVNKAAVDLRSFGMPQSKFEEELGSTADKVAELEEEWKNMYDSGRIGDILGRRTCGRDMTSKILSKKADSARIEVLLDTVRHALKHWVRVGQQKMEIYANEAKDDWKRHSPTGRGFFKPSSSSPSDPPIARSPSSHKRQDKYSDDQQGRPTANRKNPDNIKSTSHNVAGEGLAHDQREIAMPSHGNTKKTGDKAATQDNGHRGKATTGSSRETEAKTKALPNLGKGKANDHRETTSGSQKFPKDALEDRLAKDRELKYLLDDLDRTIKLYYDLRQRFESMRALPELESAVFNIVIESVENVGRVYGELLKVRKEAPLKSRFHEFPVEITKNLDKTLDNIDCYAWLDRQKRRMPTDTDRRELERLNSKLILWRRYCRSPVEKYLGEGEAYLKKYGMSTQE